MDSLATGQTTLRDKAGIRRYYIRYTLVFAVIAFCSFSAYIFSGKTLIWTDDAWSQHYKAFVYYSEYLRSMIDSLFRDGRLVIPEWDFGFGEGGDVLTTLHYYVIGDPLTVLSVLVPVSHLHILFDFLTILRIYLAGAVFSYYCILMGQRNEHAVAVGALIYSLSHWAILNAGRHPYFLNPMLYFPLLLIGMEFVIRHRRPYLLTVIVAVSALSNFYFFYMLVFLSAFSVLARVIYIARRGLLNIKGAVAIIMKVAFWSLLGVIMAAVILVPITAAFLQESRAEVDYAVGLFYPLKYYTKLPGIIAGEGGAGAMTGEYWLCAGFPVVTLPCMILLFRGRSHKFTKFLLVTVAVAICIPGFGYALNGFSYVTNRWIWALALLAAYVVTMMWHRLTTVEFRDYIVILTVECALLALCLILEGSRTVGAISTVLLTITMLIVVSPRRRRMTPRKRELIMSVFTGVSIVVNSLSFTAWWGLDYASQHVDRAGIADALYDNDTAYVQKQAEAAGITDFYRYSGFDLTQNAGALVGLSSTQYYWSLSNPNLVERNTELALRDYLLNSYSGYDGRTIMNTLTSVRYFVRAKGTPSPIPYGYDMILPESVTDQYYIYENENALPLGYTYGTVLDSAIWDSLTPSEREEAMLYGAYVPDGGLPLPAVGADRVQCESVPFTVRCVGDGVTYEDGKFIVTEEGSPIVLTFERRGDMELSLFFKDFYCESTPEYDLYFGGDEVDPNGLFGADEWNELSLRDRLRICNDKIFWTEPTGTTLKIKSGTVENSLMWYGRDFQFYNGRDDFVVNLGYHFGGVSTLSITFPRPGVYTFGGMEVICRPMRGYTEAVDALREDILTDVTFGVDAVSGSISLSEPKLLLMTIPYSDGWSATVDGEPTELIRANISYMGLMLDAGEHEIELHYRTPYKRVGGLISAVGVALFAVSIVAFEVCRKRRIRKERSLNSAGAGTHKTGGADKKSE